MFLYDDLSFIQFNPFIRSLRFLPEYFLNTDSVSDYGHALWRPLRTLSFAIDFRLWGLHPLGFHLTNVTFHWLNVLLVYWLVSLRMALSFGSVRWPLPVTAALLFALHPVQTEVVCWTSSRGDLLFSSCALMAVLCHWYRGKDSREAAWMLGSLTCYALALLSKETALVLPLIFMASDRLLDQRSWSKTWQRSIPFWLMASAFLWSRTYILGSVAQRDFWGGGLYPTTLVMLKVAASYLRLLVWPVGLRVDYAVSIPTTLHDPQVLLALVVLIPAAVAAWWLGHQSRIVAFWLTWSIVWMLPVSNIIPFHGLLAGALSVPQSGGMVCAWSHAVDSNRKINTTFVSASHCRGGAHGHAAGMPRGIDV